MSLNLTYNSTTVALTCSHFAESSEISSYILRIADFVVPVSAFSRRQTMIYITPVGMNTETLTQIDVFCMKTAVINVKLQTKITVNVIT